MLPWYWLVYFLGFFFLYYMGRKTIQDFKLPITSYQWHITMSLGFWAMLLGGRLFYIVVYHPSYYVQNPQAIFEIWKGGMSFHGALLATIFFIFFIAKKFSLSFFNLTDILAIFTPFVLFWGRCANFMNGELAGRIIEGESVPWAVIFPRYGDGLPRHPSQIYEALTQGLLLFVILYYLKNNIKTKGLLSGLFLILYGGFRFFTEFFRAPDPQLGFLQWGLTMGQWLCLFMICGGGVITFFAISKKVPKKVPK